MLLGRSKTSSSGDGEKHLDPPLKEDRRRIETVVLVLNSATLIFNCLISAANFYPVWHSLRVSDIDFQLKDIELSAAKTKTEAGLQQSLISLVFDRLKMLQNIAPKVTASVTKIWSVSKTDMVMKIKLQNEGGFGLISRKIIVYVSPTPITILDGEEKSRLSKLEVSGLGDVLPHTSKDGTVGLRWPDPEGFPAGFVFYYRVEVEVRTDDVTIDEVKQGTRHIFDEKVDKTAIKTAISMGVKGADNTY